MIKLVSGAEEHKRFLAERNTVKAQERAHADSMKLELSEQTQDEQTDEHHHDPSFSAEYKRRRAFTRLRGLLRKCQSTQ